MPSGGGMSAGVGMGQAQTFETYSLDKLTVASVTSQEHMTVSITIDELDITSIYVGQEAIVSVDALGGEQFEAQISKISNSGENEGGNRCECAVCCKACSRSAVEAENATLEEIAFHCMK